MGLELKPSETADTTETYKIVGKQFGSNDEFELQDHVEINSDSSKLEVKLLGRKDDLIVLATGEKVSPHLMEKLLGQHPLIKWAVVFGEAQFEVGVLVEPYATAMESSRDNFVDAIWATVLDANSKVDQHACLFSKAAILVKPPAKILPLSDKGWPQRREVYQVFDPEIRSVYSNMENAVHTSSTHIDFSDLRQSLRDVVQSILPSHVDPGTWNDDDDLIQLGMDSLRATQLRRILEQSFGRSQPEAQGFKTLPFDFVYSHPSISQLHGSLKGRIDNTQNSTATSEFMINLANKYAFQRDRSSGVPNYSVLLTGSTGNLGSYLLKVLTDYPRVRQVFCLVRMKSGHALGDISNNLLAEQREKLDDRGLKLSKEAWSKVEVLPWEPGRDSLGLERNVYDRLASKVTHIFHGAWPMNFQMKVSSFESQIKALHDLIKLARSSHRLQPTLKPRFIFASSIAAVGNALTDTSHSRVVPEASLHDPGKSPLAMGYAQAKWVCEQVVESAFSTLQSEIQPSIIRIGQISGSQNSGYWSEKEHFPALAKASLAIGGLPDLQGVRSMIMILSATTKAN